MTRYSSPSCRKGHRRWCQTQRSSQPRGDGNAVATAADVNDAHLDLLLNAQHVGDRVQALVRQFADVGQAFEGGVEVTSFPSAVVT